MLAANHARRMVQPLARAVRRNLLPHLLIPPSAGRSMHGRPDGILVVGLMSSASGLGNSARLCADQLMARGYSVSSKDVAPFFGVSDDVGFASNAANGSGASIAIYHLNPPKLLPGLMRAGLRQYYGSYNIGYWAWELETLPREWVDAIRFVDAIMVPSEFCRAAISRYTGKPVAVVPHPLQSVQPLPPRTRDESQPFTVLSMLNFGSSFRRKNPYAALRAFALAFGTDPNARLIFKTSGGHRYPGELAQLRANASAMPNVEIVDEIWSEERLNAAYRRADAYLSLHRSEGYGLTIAEAMMMECPVVVTGWSGNLDFCTEETAFLVRHTLTAFDDDDPSYEGVTGARWAEPSVEDAARLLRLLRDEPALARRKADAARRHLIAHTSERSYDRALKSLLGDRVPERCL
jgi:glycosyltransferase involved in cell wall biosynthesis